MHRGFRYELKPTAAQAQTLREWVGVTRLVYNLCLEQRRDFWRQFRRAEGRPLTWAEQCRQVTDLRAEFDWIAAAPRNALDRAVRDLDAAFAAFFAGRARHPTPRRKGSNDTFRLKSEDVAVKRLNGKWSAVRLPKIGWVKFRDTRAMVGELRNVTISMSANRWAVVFAREIDADPVFDNVEAVGIDRGVAQTLTLSNGEVIQAPDTSRLLRMRKRAQRRVARGKRGSARNRAKKFRVARLDGRLGRVRADWCHRASAALARRFSVVAIENLNIGGMTASGPGKRGINRSILEQCWGKFATFLDYKLTERGGRLISVPAAYTSQTCASCGVVDARSRKSQAVFACVHCDHTDNADVNAAKEILRRSTAWLDVEGRVAGSTKRQSGRSPKPEFSGNADAR